jgi:membrane protein
VYSHLTRREAGIDRLKRFGRILWNSITEFMSDDCPSMAASLSYYTVFSLPPLLALLTLIVGSIVPPDQFRELLSSQVGQLMGTEGRRQVIALIEGASRPEIRGIAAVIGIVVLLFAATGAFVQLQTALNRAWQVMLDPARSDLSRFLVKRLISLAMILSIGFLLLVSLVLSTVTSAASGAFSAAAPDWLASWIARVVDIAASLAMTTFLFAAIFQFVPDAEVRWRHALVGGFATGLLFTAGKFAIGFYFGRSDPGSVYGAAGSLALTLIWIYYSAIILLLGAEFTEAWAREHGAPLKPERGAVGIRRVIVPLESTEPDEKSRRRIGRALAMFRRGRP